MCKNKDGNCRTMIFINGRQQYGNCGCDDNGGDNGSVKLQPPQDIQVVIDQDGKTFFENVIPNEKTAHFLHIDGIKQDRDIHWRQLGNDIEWMDTVDTLLTDYTMSITLYNS